MELDKLYIHYLSTGPVCHCNPVAGGYWRIGGKLVDLANTAACDKYIRRWVYFNGSVGKVNADYSNTAARRSKYVKDEIIRPEINMLKFPGKGDKFFFNLFPGCISSGMKDPRMAVSSLGRKAYLSFGNIEFGTYLY